MSEQWTACLLCLNTTACHECAGRGAVTCASCDGQGCERCEWSGAVRCVVCWGSGACFACLARAVAESGA